ncbi:MAG: LacI family DNA-binding transcriptional regulator [Lentisphaeria bacterium]|nr:LacI family DNA-binding transcriptional regulator [Lentisphaeria bacterium]
MPKKMTAADIARLAGVSRSTVSRALNPDTCWRISREKCEEIRNLCRKHGVMPSRAARPDRLKPTRRIALVLGAMERDLGKPESGAMIRRMCDVLQGSGCTLELIRADHRPGRLAPHIRRILDSNTADVYIAGGLMLNGQSLELLRRISPRLILTLNEEMARCPYPDHRWLSYFMYDSSSACSEAFAAIPREHRARMLFFGRDARPSKIKIERIRRLISRHGGTPGELQTLLFGDGRDLAYPEAWRLAVRAIRRHIDRIAGFTAIWGSGWSAHLLYDELVAAGRVPGRDFTLITTGSAGQSLPPLEPGINFICRDMDQAAEMLCEYALRLIDEPHPGRVIQKAVFRPARYDLLDL